MRPQLLFVVLVPIAVVFAVLPAAPAPAQTITDLTYDLAALSEPDLLVDWAASGTGVRSGIRITTTSGITRYYTNSGLSLDSGEAFLMDAVLSAQQLVVDEERGARMWVRFRDAATPPIQSRRVEARLYRDSGTYRVGVFGDSGATVPLGSLPQDWTSAAPRLRVRIRYQEVGGVPTIFLTAQDSTQWTSDLSGPLTPNALNSLSLPVDNVSFPASSGSSEFGFGNFVAGAYSSDIENVRIIRSSEPDTFLPALLAANVPVLSAHGVAALAMLFAIVGWACLLRFRV